MGPSVPSDESPAERYRRELRDLMVAGLDFNRFPASPPATQNAPLRADVELVAEYVSEADLFLLAPAVAAAAVRAAVAEDILACVEHGRWDRLRPTAWAVRVRFRWWFELGWLGRLRCRLRGEVPRPGGRPLADFRHAEPGRVSSR